jgi:hypothetical protein
MVTFTCEKNECENKGIDYNFLGNPKHAQCGGCETVLEAKDERPDPINETPLYPEAE